jgi:hypothetical protein
MATFTGHFYCVAIQISPGADIAVNGRQLLRAMQEQRTYLFIDLSLLLTTPSIKKRAKSSPSA